MINQIVAGDTLDFSTTVTGYPPSAGWTLMYRLVPRAAGPAAIIIATAVGLNDDHRAQVAPAITAAYAVGDYSWSSWVQKTGARYSVGAGQVKIWPDPSAIGFFDNRSYAAQLLAAMEASMMLQGSNARLKYTIGDRQVEYKNYTDLLAARTQLKREVASEDAASRMANGMRNPRFMGSSFDRYR